MYIVHVCWKPVLSLCYKVFSVMHSVCVLGASLVAILQGFASDSLCMWVGGLLLSLCYKILSGIHGVHSVCVLEACPVAMLQSFVSDT